MDLKDSLILLNLGSKLEKGFLLLADNCGLDRRDFLVNEIVSLNLTSKLEKKFLRIINQEINPLDFKQNIIDSNFSKKTEEAFLMIAINCDMWNMPLPE